MPAINPLGYDLTLSVDSTAESLQANCTFLRSHISTPQYFASDVVIAPLLSKGYNKCSVKLHFMYMQPVQETAWDHAREGWSLRCPHSEMIVKFVGYDLERSTNGKEHTKHSDANVHQLQLPMPVCVVSTLPQIFSLNQRIREISNQIQEYFQQ